MGLVFSSIDPEEYDAIMHYGRSKLDGAPKGSGRYPLGSGENPYQHDGGYFAGTVRDLRKSGMSDVEIAQSLGMSTTQLRARYSLSKDAQKAESIAQVIKLHDEGNSNAAIAKIMGIAPNTVSNYLDPVMSSRVNKTQEVADILKREIDKKKYLDIGSGVEYQLQVSNTRLKTAVAQLEDQGYKKQFLAVPQANNPGKKTSIMVLTKDDVDWKTLYKNRDKIQSVLDVYSNDGGKSFRGLEKPVDIDPKRVQVRYTEDGGGRKDGVIELRPGVDDISLGANHYAQVRISVGGTHYLKGMAVYNDNLPPGVDIIFNTSKHKGTPMMGDKDHTVLKTLKDDPDNPFGSTVRQKNYIGKDGEEHLSAINIVNEDKDWGKWAKTVSSQMLSKQRPEVAKAQLDVTYRIKEAEFKDIQAITNPVVRKRLLQSFADDCDAAAVHLKAQGFSRQASHVLLPVDSLKDNEIYAPNYKNGEEVILVRHPHQGVFEIPVLKVNNKNAEGKKMLGNAAHAVGINANVAQQLSGADFDGDTALVIPTINQKFKTSRDVKPGSQLLELKNFDPKEAYSAYEGMPKTGPATGFHKQKEMGKISNLITDMSVGGANESEIARATRHALVVIDAEKHNLNWRLSEKDNGIKELKEKYQGGANKGAATVISRAKSKEMVDVRGNKWGERDAYNIDPETGKKIFTYYNETYTNKAGKIVKRQTESRKMYEVEDAYKLTSGGSKDAINPPIEKVYANYANQMKNMANQARKELVNTPSSEYSPTARQTYQTEVDSLNAKLNVAKKHAPNERRAQLVTNKIMEIKLKENPSLADDKDERKKVTAQVLDEQRRRVGGKKDRISITEKEWAAIDAGAISKTKLEDILNNTDVDVIKKYATPRQSSGLTKAQISLAKSLLGGEKPKYTQAEVAERLGVSVNTLMKAIE